MRLTPGMVRHLFKSYLSNRAYSGHTIIRYLRETDVFSSWLFKKRKKEDLREVTKEDIIEYQMFLSQAKKKRKNDYRFSPQTQKGMLRSLNILFRFLSRSEYILSSPFDALDISIITVKKLRESIPEEDMHRLLDGIPLNSPLTIRDRAVFELLYGTGLRVGEVTNLNLTDVDLNSGKLLVRQGKGKKDRIVPIGKNVAWYLELYLKKSRDLFLREAHESAVREAFFLGANGSRLNISTIEVRLRKWSKGIGKRICPHMLRHSFATHILDHGAGIKAVKEILGHTCIETTVGYTHFSIKSLKRILKMYHPRENELFVELTKEEAEAYQEILNLKNV